MSSHNKWKALLGGGLVLLSVLFYGLHYLIFNDPHHIWIYLVGDIAFVPLEVLLVTLILHELLDWREKRSKLQKLNMAIGVFYSEMGADLLRRLRTHLAADALGLDRLAVAGPWQDKEFGEARKYARSLSNLQFETQATALQELSVYLKAQRPFLLGLLENPNLLEHEAFTDVLWAVFHLTDELAHRDDFASLPGTDRRHLSGDMERAFTYLLQSWLSYMQHLQKDYPYLFSLAVRTNPFAEGKTAVVKE